MEYLFQFIDYVSIWMNGVKTGFAFWLDSRVIRTIWKHYVENVSNDQSSCLTSTANRHSSDVNRAIDCLRHWKIQFVMCML